MSPSSTASVFFSFIRAVLENGPRRAAIKMPDAEPGRGRLDGDWGPVSKGAADLRALPAEVLSVFSRRRQEIVEAAREAGVQDLASERGKYLAVLTRERKQYGVETHTWREEVRARAGEHGLDQDTIEQLVDTGHTRLAAGELGCW
jgi:hypothetical protein